MLVIEANPTPDQDQRIVASLSAMGENLLRRLLRRHTYADMCVELGVNSIGSHGDHVIRLNGDGTGAQFRQVVPDDPAVHQERSSFAAPLGRAMDEPTRDISDAEPRRIRGI
jgi:hypothetical protein